jgi:hypothetical protein
LSYTYPIDVIGKENSERFIHAQLTHMRLLLIFGELSNHVDTTEQVQCVLRLMVLQSLTAVQRCFRMQYGRQPPTPKIIRFWDNKLRNTGSLLGVKSPGKTRTSKENVNRIGKAFQRSPKK